MSKIKPMVYRGDVNMFAINEYDVRAEHYRQITQAIEHFRPAENINNYLRLIRIYKGFLNAETNIELMIDYLYKARRGIEHPDERFYPCGKTSRCITKLEYLEHTIDKLELLLIDNDYIHDKVKHSVNYYGIQNSPHEYINVLHQRLNK